MLNATQVFAGEGTEVTYIGEEMGDQWVRNSDGSTTQVFCVNEGRQYSASYAESHNRSNVRIKYSWNEEPTRHNNEIEAWTDPNGAYHRNYAIEIALLGNMYNNTGNARTDIGEHEFTFRDVSDGALAGLLTKVLYLGAPNNGEGDNFSADDTQAAVYWCVYSGKNNPEGTGGNALVQKALALDYGTIENKIEGLYVYVLTPEMTKNGGSGNTYWEQCMVSAEFKTEDKTDGSIKTTVTAGGKTASESSEATLTAEEAKSVKSVTDKIDYEGLKAGATYKVSGTLNEVEGGSVVKQIATATAECIAEDSSGSWNITFDNVKLEAGKTYVVFEEAVNAADENEKYEHKEASDKSQTIVVEKDDEPSSEETTTPSAEETTTTSKDDETTTPSDEDTTSPEDDDNPGDGGSKTDNNKKDGSGSSVKDDGSNAKNTNKGGTTTIKKSNSATTKAATKTTSKSAPKTGDESSTTLWIVLMLAALAAVTVIIYRRKARQ